jgi:ATP-binding cassette, subfamily F, member 3
VPAGTADDSASKNGAASEKPKRKPKPKGPSKNRLSAQEQAEREIDAAEAAMRRLEGELADPAAWASKYESAKSEARLTAAKRAIEQAYERLEALID